MSECKTCRFYEAAHGGQGICRNLGNATTRWVGGGGEYSSSEQCLVPAKVYESQGCELHQVGTFRQPVIAPMSQAQQDAIVEGQIQANQAMMNSMRGAYTWQYAPYEPIKSIFGSKD